MEKVSYRLFIDTNAFLQLRDLKDLPWREVLPDADVIDLYVAPIVIEELDTHKISTNKRRRDRSRLALALIEEASQNPERTIVLREGPITVRLSISVAPRFEWNEQQLLDQTRPDDQLVAEALSADTGASVFSHDTGPRIRARLAGLQALTPPDTWLLQPEQTDDQRKINNLERQLSAALNSKPQILFTIGGTPPLEEIKCVIPILEPLNHREINLFVDAYLSRNPKSRESRINNTLLPAFEAHLNAEYSKYERNYEAFKIKVRDYFSRINELIQNLGRLIEINYELENVSQVSALGLRVEFEVFGKICIIASRDDSPYYASSTLPEAPILSPHLTRIGPNSAFARAVGLKDRDPTKFYWQDRPEIGSRRSANQCAEFRASRKYSSNALLLPISSGDTDEFRINGEISSTNMSQPIIFSSKLYIDRQRVSFKSKYVRNLIPNKLLPLWCEVFPGDDD